MTSSEDNYFMEQAIILAHQASSRGDVPVGAILVKNGEILSSGSDIKTDDPTAHAEMTAIRSGSQRLGHWNLSGCTLYVTLEPCPMCAGACISSRISRVVYGAKNPKAGAGGSLYNILHDTRLNHVCDITSGVLAGECVKILQDYFMHRRAKSCSRRA